jgi:sulfur carrier protein ThiS
MEKEIKMTFGIQIHLYGSLRNMGKKHDEFTIKQGLESEAPLVDILKQVKIPPDRVQLVMVNHKAVHMDSTVCPGDRIALFPMEYPVFADWKDFRRDKCDRRTTLVQPE